MINPAGIRAVVILVAIIALVPAMSPAQESKAKRVGAVDEIVVYARKRAELLEETPVSVTAFNADQLSVTGTTSIDQIQTMVPNLTMLRGANGQTASFNMRGVGNFPSIHFDQGVGVYVDGIYLARNPGTILDIVDTAGVEVLRGPQGTLFGKNTLGGAINITTIKPQNEFSSSLFIRAGSYNQIDTKATLNLPIAFGLETLEDRLFGRFTFASFNHDGYVYNSFRDEDVADRNSINFLGSLRFLASDDVTIDVSGMWSKSHTRGLGAKCIYIEPEAVDTAFGLILGSIDQILTANGSSRDEYRDRCNATTPFRVESDDHGFFDISSYGTWGILNWDVGNLLIFEDVSVMLRSGWREQRPRGRTDLDQTPFPLFTASTAGGGPNLVTGTGPRAGEVVDIGGAPGEQRQIQQEMQVNMSAADDRIQVVGGVFGYWENAENNFGVSLLPGTLVSEPPLGLGLSRGDVKTSNWDWAVYSQATFTPWEWLSLTGGIRYTQEKKGLSRILRQPNGEVEEGNPLSGDPLPVNFSESEIFTDASPMGTLSLTVPDSWLEVVEVEHLMGYFTYSEGFRGGGFNGDARFTTDALRIPFKPETIESLEWGVKSLLFDHRLSLSAAYFRHQRSDQQIPQVIPCDTCAAPVFDILTTNAGQSTAQGFEIELLAQPLPQMAVRASAGYLDAVYDDFANTRHSRTDELINRAGQRFNFLPEWQTHLGAQYSFEIADLGPAWTDGSFTPRLDWSWQSRTTNWAIELPELIQPKFHLLNLRSTYAFNNDKTSLALFVNNVTDEEYFRDSIALGPRATLVVGKYYQPPRWWGVEISQSF